MKKTKSTKRALLSAILALVMTVSMLVGTTFAWFTDSVTSSNNVIKAGNLDISLEYLDGDTWTDVAGSSEILDKDALWEPGYTEVVYFKIQNVGSLDLKYMFGVNVISEIAGVNQAGAEFKLSDYIYFDTLVMTSFEKFPSREAAKAIATEQTIISEGFSRSSTLEAGSAPVYIAMVVYMPESVGNAANHNGINVPEITLGVDVVATQVEGELDSFGPDYDKEATYPSKITVNVPASSNATTLKIGEVSVEIPAGNSGNFTLVVDNANMSESADGTVLGFDITLLKNGEAIDPSGAVEYPVSIYIGENKDVSRVLHNGVDVDHYFYDPITGFVSFNATSFSPFEVHFADADSESVFTPADPEAAEKLDKADVIAVDADGNEYASLKAAINSGASKIYLKAGADLGTVTHLDVDHSVTIYGNGAYISGGERDFAIDTYKALSSDIEVKVYNLHGVAFWGQRNTSYTVDLELYNCNDLGRIYLNGTSGVNNVGLYGCTATSISEIAYENTVGDTVVYSNANGKLVIDGCSFEAIGCPVNLNHKIAGEQTVIVKNSTFVDCATSGTAAYYAPIRLYNSVDGANQTVTVESNAFIYSEGKAPINGANILLNKVHDGKDASGTIKATVQMTSAVVGKNVDVAYTVSNADELFAFAAEVNKYYNYEHPFAGQTIKLTSDIDLEGAEWTPIGDYRFSANRFCGTFDGDGHTISNFKITKKTDKNDSDKSAYGFFGNLSGVVKNLTIDGANIDASVKFAGVLVGRFNTCTCEDNVALIENCNVVNSSVAIQNWTVGALVGQYNDGKISGCTVEKCSVTGYSGVGGICGLALNEGERVIENCSVKDCEFIQNGNFGGVYDKLFGAVVGALYSGKLTVNLNGCKAEGNTFNGEAFDLFCGLAEDGDVLYIDGALCVYNESDLAAAINNGGNIVLGSNIELSKTIPISNADFAIDGNGYTITQAADCTNTYALFDITGGKASFKNVKFDGISEGAVIRTVNVELTVDNASFVNGKHTQQQGLLRLMGKSTITNSTFANNECNMVITLNYDGANNDPQVVDGCVFENNTCNATAVVYYVKGAGATINGNKFVGNTVNCNNNGATLYMGFTEGNVITNNVFEENTVNESSNSKRVAGAIMLGYEAVVSGNAFIDNKVTGTNAKGNDVCASVYYTDIDLSGNYWGGEAPVENENYFVEYPDKNKVIISDYLTSFGE